MKLAESSRINGKWTKEDNIQKYLPTFIFLSGIAQPNINILGTYN